MPLVLMCGYPCSGKSTRSQEIKKFFEQDYNKTVHIVSDDDIIKSSGINKHDLYFNSQKEKEIRGILKSEALRLLGKDDVVILDSGNYIKGYRYELYCASKSCKTTQVTVECAVSESTAWEWNEQRPDEDKYSKEAFEALRMRYEAPNSSNRWDKPLFVLQPDNRCPAHDLYSVLYEREPPPPNQSTQSAPLAPTNFLYELDRITQEIVNSIMVAKKLGLEGSDVKVPGFEGCTLSKLGPEITPAQLARYRRQFLKYTKLNPPSASQHTPEHLSQLFVQFLNTTLAGVT